MIVAIITDKAISAAFAAIESGISNSTLKPSLSCTTPIPSVSGNTEDGADHRCNIH